MNEPAFWECLLCHALWKTDYTIIGRCPSCELLKSRTDKHEREEGMEISWKPVDDDSIYLPFLGVVECGVEPHERGRLLDITNLYEALKRIESNEANVLVNVTSLKEHLLEQIKNNR